MQEVEMRVCVKNGSMVKSESESRDKKREMRTRVKAGRNREEISPILISLVGWCPPASYRRRSERKLSRENAGGGLTVKEGMMDGETLRVGYGGDEGWPEMKVGTENQSPAGPGRSSMWGNVACGRGWLADAGKTTLPENAEPPPSVRVY
ncbi:hypothetical protein L2E82_25892 [Cichorium intybus]|uniref:Uncharacterized protein n=1 Tax=Cichorium intybus TaxID=13427 RepID=A0ACB9E5G2_CICIN|nr:hypothetical protein L2E82_25892 [Cichorium intybus]